MKLDYVMETVEPQIVRSDDLQFVIITIVDCSNVDEM